VLLREPGPEGHAADRAEAEKSNEAKAVEDFHVDNRRKLATLPYDVATRCDSQSGMAERGCSNLFDADILARPFQGIAAGLEVAGRAEGLGLVEPGFRDVARVVIGHLR
jgi:hypothetical protein